MSCVFIFTSDWQLSAGEWMEYLSQKDLLSNVLILLRLRSAAVEAESCSAAANRLDVAAVPE